MISAYGRRRDPLLTEPEQVERVSGLVGVKTLKDILYQLR